MKLRKTLAGILGAVVMLLGVGTFEHVNRETGVKADSEYFTKVTDVSQLSDGAKIVITYNDQYALSTTQNTNNRAAKSFDLNKPLSEQVEIQEITLELYNSNYYFKVGEDKYLYASGTSGNQLKTSTKTTASTKGLFEIKITDNVTYITSTNSDVRGSLRYNYNQGTPIFNCYKSDADEANMPYTTIYLHIGQFASEEEINASKIKEMVVDYYNDGLYTKKSNINLNDNVTGLDFTDIFHYDDNQPISLNRTTYYTPNALFMANFDGSIGGEGKINSGYRNNGSNLEHFTLDSNNDADPDWEISNTSLNTFFVTLEKMTKDNYFLNEAWSFTSTSSSKTATYEPEKLLSDDQYLKDFLAFTAPCLEEIVLSKTYENYFVFDKLTISTGKHEAHGEFLSLKMHLNSTVADGTLVANANGILSEARIYKDNKVFDEDTYNFIVSKNAGGTVVATVNGDEIPVEQNNYIKNNSNVVIEIKPDEGYTVKYVKHDNVDITGDLDLVNGGSLEVNVDGNTDVEVSFEKESSGEETTLISGDVTLSFANKDNNRVSFSKTQQIWSVTLNNVTLEFENNKASSSNDIADYQSPVRLYAKSEIKIYSNVLFEKIVFDCNSASYATALNNSIGTVDGATISVSSDKVTVVFENPVASFTVASLTAQVRLDNITIGKK